MTLRHVNWALLESIPGAWGRSLCAPVLLPGGGKGPPHCYYLKGQASLHPWCLAFFPGSPWKDVWPCLQTCGGRDLLDSMGQGQMWGRQEGGQEGRCAQF